MKLRTALAQLKSKSTVCGYGVSLSDEVIAMPSDDPGFDAPELLALTPKGSYAAREGFGGITIVPCSDEMLQSHKPAERCVLVVSDLTREELEEAYAKLPQLHMQLDLQRKRIYKAFQASYDIQRFAERLFEILGNPLMIVNSDRRLLASAGEFPENRADVLDEINQGYISEEVNAEMEAAGILDDVRHAGHSIISENARFNQRWVTSIISYHHMELGRLDMLEKDCSVSEACLELVDFAGSLAAVLIDKLGIAGRRAGSGSSVLDDILANTMANEKTMRAQLVMSSMPLDDTYVLMELAGERELTRDHLQRIALRVSQAFRHCLWTLREGKLVIMVAIGARTSVGWDAYDRAERAIGQRKEFTTILERNGLTAYVGEPFEQMSLAPARFKQVLDLAAAGIRTTGRILYFWHRRYEVIASQAPSFAHVDMMLDKRVVAMSVYDRDHGTYYLDTACRTVEFPGTLPRRQRP